MAIIRISLPLTVDEKVTGVTLGSLKVGAILKQQKKAR